MILSIYNNVAIALILRCHLFQLVIDSLWIGEYTWKHRMNETSIALILVTMLCKGVYLGIGLEVHDRVLHCWLKTRINTNS